MLNIERISHKWYVILNKCFAPLEELEKSSVEGKRRSMKISDWCSPELAVDMKYSIQLEMKCVGVVRNPFQNMDINAGTAGNAAAAEAALKSAGAIPIELTPMNSVTNEQLDVKKTMGRDRKRNGPPKRPRTRMVDVW